MSRVHHIALLVEDLEGSERFYREVVGLELDRRWPDESGGTRSVWLRAGELLLMLERAAPGDARRDERGGGWHLVAFAIAPGEREAVRERLVSAGVTIESESEHSLYFRDPEGNRLALSHWPEVAS